MKQIPFTVAVPAYNAEKTLAACLKSITDSAAFSHHQLIVVDDGSSDRTSQIAADFTQNVLRHKVNRGRIQARQTALDHAQGDIIVFVDADIVLEPTSIRTFITYFSDHPEVGGVSGKLAAVHPIRNFPSEYKNFYMHIASGDKESDISFFYGGFHAYRKKIAVPYDLMANHCNQEDIEYAQKLVLAGHSLRMLPDVQVRHLHEYTWKSVLWAHYDVSAGLVRTFFHYKWILQMQKGSGRYANADFSVLFSMILTPVVAIVSGIAVIKGGYQSTLILLMVWLAANLRFCVLFYRRFGFAKSLVLPSVLYIDHFCRLCGVMVGLAELCSGPKLQSRKSF